MSGVGRVTVVVRVVVKMLIHRRGLASLATEADIAEEEAERDMWEAFKADTGTVRFS